MSVATGADWWGRKTYPGRVLYITWKSKGRFFGNRLSKIIEKRALKLHPGEFDVWNLRGHAADIDMLVPEITKQIQDRNYALIIIDPIYKCLGDRDENKAGDIAALMNKLEKLGVESGAAVAFWRALQ